MLQKRERERARETQDESSTSSASSSSRMPRGPMWHTLVDDVTRVRLTADIRRMQDDVCVGKWDSVLECLQTMARDRIAPPGQFLARLIRHAVHARNTDVGLAAFDLVGRAVMTYGGAPLAVWRLSFLCEALLYAKRPDDSRRVMHDLLEGLPASVYQNDLESLLVCALETGNEEFARDFAATSIRRGLCDRFDIRAMRAGLSFHLLRHDPARARAWWDYLEQCLGGPIADHPSFVTMMRFQAGPTYDMPSFRMLIARVHQGALGSGERAAARSDDEGKGAARASGGAAPRLPGLETLLLPADESGALPAPPSAPDADSLAGVIGAGLPNAMLETMSMVMPATDAAEVLRVGGLRMNPELVGRAAELCAVPRDDDPGRAMLANELLRYVDAHPDHVVRGVVLGYAMDAMCQLGHVERAERLLDIVTAQRLPLALFAAQGALSRMAMSPGSGRRAVELLDAMIDTAHGAERSSDRAALTSQGLRMMSLLAASLADAPGRSAFIAGRTVAQLALAGDWDEAARAAALLRARGVLPPHVTGDLVLAAAHIQSIRVGAPAVQQTLAQVQSRQSPSLGSTLDGRWRRAHALAHALLGHWDEAIDELSDTITRPSPEDADERLPWNARAVSVALRLALDSGNMSAAGALFERHLRAPSALQTLTDDGVLRAFVEQLALRHEWAAAREAFDALSARKDVFVMAMCSNMLVQTARMCQFDEFGHYLAAARRVALPTRLSYVNLGRVTSCAMRSAKWQVVSECVLTGTTLRECPDLLAELMRGADEHVHRHSGQLVGTPERPIEFQYAWDTPPTVRLLQSHVYRTRP